MLKRRDEPLSTFEELLRLNNIPFENSKDGSGHLHVLDGGQKVELDETFNLFDDSYIPKTQQYTTRCDIKYELQEVLDVAPSESQKDSLTKINYPIIEKERSKPISKPIVTNSAA